MATPPPPPPPPTDGAAPAQDQQQQQPLPPLPSLPPPSRYVAGREMDDETLLTPTMVELSPRGGIEEGRRVALVHLVPLSRAKRREMGGGGKAAEEEEEEGIEAEEQEEEEEERAAEEEEGITIFLMHGACASLRHFAALIPPLARRHRVVAFDAFGCGRSPKPDYAADAYATEELFEDLLEVYRRYKGRRNLLVGHSFGSSQVMRLAAHIEAEEAAAKAAAIRPKGVTEEEAATRPPAATAKGKTRGASEILGLVLLASAYHVPDGGNPIFALPLPVLTLLKPVISQVFRARAIDRHCADRTQMMEDDARTSSSNPMHMVKAFYQRLKWVPRERIHALKAPCVVIHGETDGIIPLYQARALAANLARAQLYVLRQTGHQVMMERPKETLALIEAFIHDLTYPPPPEGGGDRDKGEPALLAVGEEKRMATEIHPGRFPSWVRAEGEQEQEQGSGGGGEGEGNVP